MNYWHVRKAVNLLRQGAVVACPTETVWGFGCMPTNQDALQRILRIKQRAFDKGVILIGSDLDQFSEWIKPLNFEQQQQISAPSSRPTTWIVPATANCPDWISGGRTTLAMRISSHPTTLEICRSVGALVSTSANKAGKPTKGNRSACLMAFRKQVDWVIPGESGPGDRPSRIIELATGKVLRD